MLVPLSRKKFEDLIPLVATGAQYKYCWGKFPDVLRRVLISIAVLAAIVLVNELFLQNYFAKVALLPAVFAMVYWLWSPVLQASLRNIAYRRFKYAGFLRGEVLDIYITDEVVGTQENVNDRGDLVIIENRERMVNLIVGDESGFETGIQVPLKREHQAIRVGDTAEMLVLSNRPDLGLIEKVSDIFVARCGVWVSDYPYLRRDEFEAVSRRLKTDPDEQDDYEERPQRRSQYDVIESEDEYDDDSYRVERSTNRPQRQIQKRVERDRPRKRIPKTGAVEPKRRQRRQR